MLQIVIPEREIYKEATNEFIYVNEQVLRLEHSLISVSKWESKTLRPFPLLNRGKLTNDDISLYVQCMTITQNVNPTVYSCLTSQNVKDINDYINSPMTATTFSNNRNTPPNRSITTSEILYYQMISLGIPVEFDKWHLNRLLALIRICSTMNQPSKKMSKNELASRNRALNAARRKQLNSNG